MPSSHAVCKVSQVLGLQGPGWLLMIEQPLDKSWQTYCFSQHHWCLDSQKKTIQNRSWPKNLMGRGMNCVETCFRNSAFPTLPPHLLFLLFFVVRWQVCVWHKTSPFADLGLRERKDQVELCWFLISGSNSTCIFHAWKLRDKWYSFTKALTYEGK